MTENDVPEHYYSEQSFFIWSIDTVYGGKETMKKNEILERLESELEDDKYYNANFCYFDDGKIADIHIDGHLAKIPMHLREEVKK